MNSRGYRLAIAVFASLLIASAAGIALNTNSLFAQTSEKKTTDAQDKNATWEMPVKIVRPQQAEISTLLPLTTRYEQFEKLPVLVNKKKDYISAIRILQRLIELPETEYVMLDWPGKASNKSSGMTNMQKWQASQSKPKVGPNPRKPGRDAYEFLTIDMVCYRILKSLPKQARELYLESYKQTSNKLYLQALSTVDWKKMQTIARIYRFTPAGQRALGTLGGWYYDLGEFGIALDYWNQVDRFEDDNQRAVNLGRKIAAYHAMGDSQKAKRLLAELKKKYAKLTSPDSDITVVAQVREVLKTVPAEKDRAVQIARDFKGAGSYDGRQPVFKGWDVISIPTWTYPAGADWKNDKYKGLLLQESMVQFFSKMAKSQIKLPKIYRENGLYYIKSIKRGVTSGGIRKTNVDIPPAMFSPIVKGDTLYFRDENSLYAFSLDSGELIWKLDVKTYRPRTKVTDKDALRNIRYTRVAMPIWRKLFAITDADDRLYITADYVAQKYITFKTWNDRQKYTSQIVAVDMQGKKIWTAGSGIGDTDILRRSAFSSGLTFKRDDDGARKIYAVALYQGKHYLVCLADMGGKPKTEFAVKLGSSVAVSTSNGARESDIKTLGDSAPCIDGNRIYVVTNAGLISAVDRNTKRLVWSRNYESFFRKYQNTSHSSRDIEQIFASPVISAGDYILVMPADKRAIICLEKSTGEINWEISRDLGGDVRYMLPLDNQRVLFANAKSIQIRDVKTGKLLFKTNKVFAPTSKPALLANSVISAAPEGVFELSWEKQGGKFSYQVKRICKLNSPAGMGSLIPLGDRMINVSPMGISVYHTADNAVKYLAKIIDRTKDPKQKADRFIDLASVYFKMNQFEKAYATIEKAEKIAAGTAREKSIKIAASDIRRQVAIARANNSDNLSKREQLYKKVLELSESDIKKAGALTMLAEFYRQSSQFEKMLAVLDQIKDFENTDSIFKQIPIGSEVKESIEDLKTGTEVTGKLWAKNFHTKAYSQAPAKIQAIFDKKIKTIFQSLVAQKKIAPLRQIISKHPRSRYASEARFEIAKILLNNQSRTAKQTAELLWVLDSLAETNCKYQAGAKVLRYAIAKANKLDSLCAFYKTSASKVDKNTAINFATFKGTAESLIAKADSNSLGIKPVAGLTDFKGQPAAKYKFPEAFLPGAKLITNSKGAQSVLPGGQIPVLQGKTLMLVSPLCNSLGDKQHSIIKIDLEEELPAGRITFDLVNSSQALLVSNAKIYKIDLAAGKLIGKIKFYFRPKYRSSPIASDWIVDNGQVVAASSMSITLVDTKEKLKTRWTFRWRDDKKINLSGNFYRYNLQMSKSSVVVPLSEGKQLLVIDRMGGPDKHFQKLDFKKISPKSRMVSFALSYDDKLAVALKKRFCCYNDLRNLNINKPSNEFNLGVVKYKRAKIIGMTDKFMIGSYNRKLYLVPWSKGKTVSVGSSFAPSWAVCKGDNLFVWGSSRDRNMNIMYNRIYRESDMLSLQKYNISEMKPKLVYKQNLRVGYNHYNIQTSHFRPVIGPGFSYIAMPVLIKKSKRQNFPRWDRVLFINPAENDPKKIVACDVNIIAGNPEFKNWGFTGLINISRGRLFAQTDKGIIIFGTPKW